MKEIIAKFILGSPTKDHFPKLGLPEYGFAGRSNVGKSSMINYLTRNNKLARTSSTPGKTREINFFDIDGEWILADLPGYGYARTGKKERARINRLIEDYLDQREEFYCLFVLIDSRIPPQQSDLEFIYAVGKKKIPLAIIFTKADKPGSSEISRNIQDFEKRLLGDWEELPPRFITSSRKKIGREEILNYIFEINRSSN